MDMKEALGNARTSRDKQIAMKGFNWLVRNNQLSKKDALDLRDNAELSLISNAAAKFLGGMSRFMLKALGWITALSIIVLIVGLSCRAIIHRVEGEQSRNMTSDHITEARNLENARITAMQGARKAGLLKTQQLKEESALENFDDLLAKVSEDAQKNSEQYFGTLQFAVAVPDFAANKIIFVSTYGYKDGKQELFPLYANNHASAFSMRVTMVKKKDNRLAEFYGQWSPVLNDGEYGCFTAKVKADGLQIQFFIEKNSGMRYVGRALLKKNT